jgi:F-type H+-transporting ATPase subunit epsilon
MTGTMRLRLLLPTEVLIDRPVARLVAEGAAGWFGVLPRHADLATALVPGLMTVTDAEGAEAVIAVDAGTFVKLGGDVLVSVRRAVQGDDLDHRRAVVDRRFRRLDARERTARSALARLESGVVRRFLDLSGSAP